MKDIIDDLKELTTTLELRVDDYQTYNYIYTKHKCLVESKNLAKDNYLDLTYEQDEKELQFITIEKNQVQYNRVMNYKYLTIRTSISHIMLTYLEYLELGNINYSEIENEFLEVEAKCIDIIDNNLGLEKLSSNEKLAELEYAMLILVVLLENLKEYISDMNSVKTRVYTKQGY